MDTSIWQRIVVSSVSKKKEGRQRQGKNEKNLKAKKINEKLNFVQRKQRNKEY